VAERGVETTMYDRGFIVLAASLYTFIAPIT